MVPKRHFSDVGGEEFPFPTPESKRRPVFRNVARDVMRDGPLNEKAWENFFRKVVREELDKKLPPYLSGTSSRPPLRIGSSSGGRGLQLQFINKLATTIFTGSKVESEDGTPLQIVLRDAATQNVVCTGPLSSVKIEVLVLTSEFGSDDQDDWTESEFSNGIVKQREGKRPLVTGGDVTLTLRDGVCFLNDIVFTDNSSWIRSRKFRLAARIVPKGPGDEVRIREAISEAFQVKDHRGELYKKHHPPSLTDEIWRLEKIAKDGAFHKRLAECGIISVKDLLQSYMKNQTSLRSCFGSVPNKMWDTIMEHALTCEIDEQKLYAYHGANVTLLFNSIYKFVGVVIDNQVHSLDQLTPPQKAMVENLKLQAYRNEGNMVLVDASTFFSLSRPSLSLPAEPFCNPNSELQQYSLQFPQQDEPAMQLEFHHALPSTSYPYQPEGNNHLMVSVAATSHAMQAFTPALRNSFSMEEFSSLQFNADNSWPQIGPTAHLGITENFFPVQTSSWSPNQNWGAQGTGFCFGSSSQAGISQFVHNSGTVKKPKACWCKLRAAIMWWAFVKARRMARLLY